MPLSKVKNSLKTIIHNEENKTLEKLEAGLTAKIGDKDINKLYNDKLNEKIDLKETVSKTLSKPTPKIKVEKIPKEITDKGKKGSERLSKYRAQVKEALELKKNLENKNMITYSDDEDDEDDEENEIQRLPEIKPQAEPQSIAIKTPEVAPMPIFEPKIKVEPTIDLTPIYGEIESLKKKNKDLEDRFLLRNHMLDISNMRRNMSIKF
jgi:ACT domain-containing protein